MIMHKSIFLLSLGAFNLCFGSDERPGSDDHRDQDRRYNEAQSTTGASEYERNADRPSWQPESGGQYDRSSESREEIGTVGPPDRDR